MPVYEHDAQQSVYGLPGLSFPVGTLSITGVVTPDIFIPMLLTSYQHATRRPKVQQSSAIPLLAGQTAYGGNFLTEGAQDLPSIALEGTMDTPTLKTGGLSLPDLIVDGERMLYGELIALYIEGRSVVGRKHVLPTWFRDPYGRQYNSPLITDFTASYVESVPGRNTFTMRMLL